eukprot:365213-Chlamydomonas_euryale.AAC.9
MGLRSGWNGNVKVGSCGHGHMAVVPACIQLSPMHAAVPHAYMQLFLLQTCSGVPCMLHVLFNGARAVKALRVVPCIMSFCLAKVTDTCRLAP